ncbi:MAG: hypothetical protein R6V67_09530 [Spirochaetia bacterium]
MGFLEKVASAFRGGKNVGGGANVDRGIYFYIKLDNSGEIVRIRLDPQHDLAPDYKRGTYFSNKTVIGPQSLGKAEATFYFNEKKEFETADISGGTISDNSR